MKNYRALYEDTFNSLRGYVAEIDNQKHKIDVQRESIKELQKQIKSLENSNRTYKRENKLLRDSQSPTSEDVVRYKKRITSLENKLDKYHDIVVGVSNKLNLFRRSNK